MESYLPLFISGKCSYNIYYRTHPNKSETAIFVCSLEKRLKKSKVKSWFSYCGKIKSLETGELEKNSQKIHFVILEFKHKGSLRRVLDNDWLQEKINETVEPEPQKPYNPELEKHVDKMEEDGFTMVLSKKKKLNKFKNSSKTDPFSKKTHKKT